MNVAGLLARAAIQHDRDEAIRFGHDTATYGELYARAARLAAGLRDLGLREGDRVALLQANGPDLVESIFGAWIAGLTITPINSRTHVREAAYIIENCEARAVIYGAEYERGLVGALSGNLDLRLICLGRDGEKTSYEELIEGATALDAPAERRPEDTAWLFYTSGTTGRPKGAMLSHRNLRQMVLSHLADVRSFAVGETVLHAAPLTHGSGLVLLACVARGARNVIYPGASFDGAEVLELIRREGATSVAFVAPTQIVVLNRAAAGGDGRPLPLESVCYGGGPMFTEDLRQAIELFGPVFVQIYGQGEAPMTISVLAASDHARFVEASDRRLGSAGVPRTDVEIKVIDEEGQTVGPEETGEVAIRGDVVMLGYWDDPEATAGALLDGWLRTGDIGMVDRTGYLHLLDRSKDMIISGGNNIYPREVEEAILELPEVRAVAVIGLPDEFWGERVHALVVLNEGHSLEEEDVIAHCRDVLSGYKKPKAVEFLPELPTNAYGKVLKRELRQTRMTDLPQRLTP
ncbi:MAG: AMP-binding protein [Solirubrobacterales bacterium]